MFCDNCGSELVKSNGPIVENYRGHEFSIEGIEHFECPACGEYTIGAAELNRFSSELARRYAQLEGLLSPAEIKAIRKRLGLTQQEFQELLGVSGVTVSRWETGAVQQTKGFDQLLRVIGEVPCAANLLMARSEVGAFRGAGAPVCKTYTSEGKPRRQNLTVEFEVN